MRFFGYIYGIFFAVLLLWCNNTIAGRSTDHAIGVNIRPSYIIPTHGFYNGWNPLEKPLRFSYSAHAAYQFSYSDHTEKGRLYPGVYQGIGLGVQSFMAGDMLGNPISLYIFQGAPLLSLSERITLDYEWNLGLSAGWKNNSFVTASAFNVYINVGLLFNWRLDDNWGMIFGPEYTHYSNGDTAFPNGGANTVNLRIGAKRYFCNGNVKASQAIIFKAGQEQTRFWQNLTYDMSLLGGCRADRMLVGNTLHIINKAFPLIGIQFNPLYHLNRCLSVGPSLDLTYDNSANLIASEDGNDILNYSYPTFYRQCAAGLSMRGELKMPIFAVNIGIGNNFSFKGSDLRGIYGVFALKAFLSDSLFLCVSYRLSSVLYSHNMMFGIGVSIRRSTY